MVFSLLSNTNVSLDGAPFWLAFVYHSKARLGMVSQIKSLEKSLDTNFRDSTSVTFQRALLDKEKDG